MALYERGEREEDCARQNEWVSHWESIPPRQVIVDELKLEWCKIYADDRVTDLVMCNCFAFEMVGLKIIIIDVLSILIYTQFKNMSYLNNLYQAHTRDKYVNHFK